MSGENDLANRKSNASGDIIEVGQEYRKKFVLQKIIPNKNAVKHNNRTCHIHDLEYYDITYNCIGISVNGLPISEKEKNKLRDYTVSNTIPVSLANMDSISALNSDNNLCEALTYQLFDLYCYKYGDQNGVLAQCIANNDFTYKGMARLLEYYDYLGFTGNHAKELLRDNARRYDKINRDQRYYLEFGRKIIREFSLKLPEVNMNEVRNHCNMMIQYDPYRLRRKVVQRAVAGTGIGIGGLLLERPDIVMSGGSLALSQFNLEDGNLLEVMEKQFKEQGIGQNTFSNMLLSAKELKS